MSNQVEKKIEPASFVLRYLWSLETDQPAVVTSRVRGVESTGYSLFGWLVCLLNPCAMKTM